MAARSPARSTRPSKQQPAVMVALLRGINVGGNKKVPMAQLRELAEGLGWRDVATYVNSGNLVFKANGAPDALAQRLAAAIAAELEFDVPVLVRSGSDLVRDLADCPFATALPDRAAQVHVGYGQGALRAAQVAQLAPYRAPAERVVVCGQAVWIDFANGVGRSKLTSAVLDRVFGGTVTLRNHNSLAAIAALAARGDASS
jgi:uncharacterized protein (DUF1697 family)